MAAPARDAAVKKKHVRFARMEDEAELEKQEEEEEEEEEEEDTLFDRRKDAGRGLRSALKAGRRSRKPGLDGVEVHGAWRGAACGRWMVTLALCASFLGLGMSISVLGPTFQDLAENVNKNISNISYIFVGRSVGYIGGSLLGGLLFDCMSPHLLLGLSMLVTALGMCAIPFCKKALLLTALMSSIGMSMGVLDTGGNVLILNTWGVQAGPHMQALHFSFAAGAFASPIIAKLLFTSDPAISPVTKPAAAPAATGNTMIRYVHGWSGSLQSMWAYVVIGGFVLLTSLLFFVLLSRGGRARERPHPAAAQPLAAKHHALLILLLCVFFFFYVGAEVAYGSFIFTFAKDYAHMEPAHAAGLNSLFWGAFAACRGLAIFFAACVSPGAMILLSLAGSTLSALLLCLFSRQKAALWACTGLYGASMATTFPSGISWVEQYTVVTGRSAALFVVGAALGEMVLPALLGFLLGRVQERPLLMYVALLTAVITSILFPLMYRLATIPAGQGGKPRGKPRPDGEDTEYRRALLDAGDEEDEEENNEADQWNDADFEVIEMDDASSLAGSPGKASSPPDLGALTGPGGASPHAAPKRVEPSPGVVSFSDTAPLMADSPRRKKLLSLAREKRD